MDGSTPPSSPQSQARRGLPGTAAAGAPLSPLREHSGQQQQQHQRQRQSASTPATPPSGPYSRPRHAASSSQSSIARGHAIASPGGGGGGGANTPPLTSGTQSSRSQQHHSSRHVSGRAAARTSEGDYFHRQNSQDGLAPSSHSRATSYTGPPKASNPNALLKVQHGVVKSRTGSVLSRGFILKNDRLPPRNTHTLDFRLKGCPNFRSGGQGIYGAAQPSITGLRTVLSLLGCSPGGSGKVVWICTREEPVVYIGGSPFVLRDAEEPLKGFALSDRPEALDGIEKRLKQDILKEAVRYGGLVQVQEEVNGSGAEPSISSTWIAASSTNVMTLRELWQSLVDEGYSVDYHRIAISSDENPENRYLDSFLDVLRDIDQNVSLFFNCGVGVVRTTFAMTVALLVRRHQATLAAASPAEPGSHATARTVSQGRDQATKAGDDADNQRAQRARRESVIDQNRQRHLIAEADAITRRNKSLLRLTSILNSGVPSSNQHIALNMLLAQPQMLENLRRAVEGDYDVILNLLSCLDAGQANKALADAAIDQCDAVINLREDVLHHRINLAMAAMDEDSRDNHLSKALAGLERYFFLVAFASYVAETDVQSGLQYSEWLQNRAELRNMVTRMRKPQNSSWVFGPVGDLSSLARGAQLGAVTPLAQSRFTDVLREGGEVITDEFAGQIVRRRRGITLRAGTILKKDIWHETVEDSAHAHGHAHGHGHASKSDDSESSVRGALNFRRIEATDVYALSQPTDGGIVGVLDAIKTGRSQEAEKERKEDRVTWVNLREEPLVYINGAPYVLREEILSLRNLKSYAGISASRLELIEDRLKADILAEIQAGDGSILLHSERADGTVVAVWERVEAENVATLREVMESLMAKRHFSFRRIPITAEGPPNFADIAELVEVVSLSPLGHSVIVNCQLGRGRSTLVSIMLALFRRWLVAGGKQRVFAEAPAKPVKTLAYAVINNLIRVIRNGREIKMHVDSAIQQCAGVFNLLDSIEDARQEAEDTSDQKIKDSKTRRGLDDLRRYFLLVLFAAWLNQASGDDVQALRDERSFKQFVRDNPVFDTIHKEIDAAGAGALIPLGGSSLGEGVASDEVEGVVARRNGRILSASTILKSDFFSNLQKLSLPDRVEGAPNYRHTSLYIPMGEGTDEHERDIKSVYGTGMPSREGLQRALERMGASKEGSTWVYWTLMREEPVIFVRGRPHVLRLLAMPLENVITTGVTAESVEGQESALKMDVLREAQKNDGRLLLHDETDDGNGRFTVTAQWEEGITAEDILTPADVYQKMVDEGYRVNYARLPVTDEQAPIPMVFARLEERVEEALQHSEVAMAFNCQMGRGRTTSAMVAAMLVASILHPPLDHAQTPNEVSPFSGAAPPDETFAIREIQDPYLNGEYKIILQMLSVLQHGKQAKRLADAAIDQCEAVQNLRKAVHSYKVQYEAAEKGSSKREKVGNLAFNYLYRYGTLIAFANYLLEKRSAMTGAMSSSFSLFTGNGDEQQQDFPSFTQYLNRKPEIDNLLKRRNLD